MNSIRNQVFTLVKNTSVGVFSGAFVTAEYNPNPPTLPCVSVQEISNAPFKRATDLSHSENLTRCEYQIDIYTSGEHKITSSAKLVKAIDTALNNIGFQRTYYANIPNAQDISIWRAVIRYQKLI